MTFLLRLLVLTSTLEQSDELDVMFEIITYENQTRFKIERLGNGCPDKRGSTVQGHACI